MEFISDFAEREGFEGGAVGYDGYDFLGCVGGGV